MDFHRADYNLRQHQPRRAAWSEYISMMCRTAVYSTLSQKPQSFETSLKVCPHYAVRHTVTQRGKAVQQKFHHAASIYGHCVGSAAACCLMLCDLKIWSANCRFHQTKLRSIWWVRGFKMVSASLRKKSDKVQQSCSTVFVAWRRSSKNSFFMWTQSHWRHMPSNFCRAANLQCVVFYPCSIVWTHLNVFNTYIENSHDYVTTED